VTHGDEEKVHLVHSLLNARGIHAEVWTPGTASARWPGMRFATDVLVSNDAGVVRSAAALTALEDAARAKGADVRFGHRVTSIHESSDAVHVLVESDDGTSEITADTVIVTAGAWTHHLLGKTLHLPRLTVTEESPAHFAERAVGGRWPSFNHILPRDGDRYPGNVYGMPTPGEGVKVGFHLVGAVVDPDTRTYAPLPERADQLRSYVREWFPGLDPDTGASISCTYTSTASEDFVLDSRGRIVVGAGFSGHGFKFTPAVGEVLARLATDPSAEAAEPFRLLS
jgi:sarcosine oxidase